MKWMNDREKSLGSELGFIVRGNNREARVVNLAFDPKDETHSAPRQTTIRPASTAEVKLWRALLQTR